MYARSAFNRYYYATFLLVRKALINIDSKYEGNIKHKNIPEILRGTIQRRIKALQRKADKLGDVSLVQGCRQASSINLGFAETLEKAYAIRVVADYTPETLVDFRSARFKLSGVPVTEAHEWVAKAEHWSIIVLAIVRQENA
ncbi:hypothetical protein [Salipiger marinus]|uniref:hypothetical protein n=1 Tax=Salipiger marinus TaxID=555512 RepID=UPI0010421621|nr:hypothetical protein [Salipiger marinus]